MAEKVRTILGDVKPDQIKAVLPHEHTLLKYGKGNTPADYRRVLPRLRTRLVKEFGELVKRGCNCFVNCDTMESFRDRNIGDELLDIWCDACRRTGMHFILTTGLYTEVSLGSWVRRTGVAELAELMLRHVTVGVNGGGVRAGMVKVSSNAYGTEKNEEKVFRAAAQVHRKTGVPITTHTPKGARPHIEFLKELGVEPCRVALGHIEVDPWEDIRRTARMGAMFNFTNWGGVNVVPEDMIVAQIVELVRQGFLKQIMISVDMYLWVNKGRLVYRWPGGYVQIFDRVVPRLMKAGLKARHIDAILYENPRRHMAF